MNFICHTEIRCCNTLQIPCLEHPYLLMSMVLEVLDLNYYKLMPRMRERSVPRRHDPFRGLESGRSTSAFDGIRRYADRLGLRWMYALAAVPLLTDLFETGRLPGVPREWITEVVGGTVIALLVRKVRKEQLAVLAASRLDALTGLWNRRAFEETLDDECHRARRSLQRLSLVYMDLDHFKQINDSRGHGAGDVVLRQLGTAIRDAVRDRVDRGFRVGGDEFALILPGSSAEQAECVVTRIRDLCAKMDAVWVGGQLAISAGVVEFQTHESASGFVLRADRTMYVKKQSVNLRVVRSP